MSFIRHDYFSNYLLNNSIMRTVVQCPTCKAVKFMTVKEEKVIWQPLTEPEFIAFEILLSSDNLQILVGEISTAHELCERCNHAIEN